MQQDMAGYGKTEGPFNKAFNNLNPGIGSGYCKINFATSVLCADKIYVQIISLPKTVFFFFFFFFFLLERQSIHFCSTCKICCFVMYPRISLINLRCIYSNGSESLCCVLIMSLAY